MRLSHAWKECSGTSFHPLTRPYKRVALGWIEPCAKMRQWISNIPHLLHHAAKQIFRLKCTLKLWPITLIGDEADMLRIGVGCTRGLCRQALGELRHHLPLLLGRGVKPSCCDILEHGRITL